MPNPPARSLLPHGPAAFDGALDVLTYNVHGLPWPVARGRADALAKIGLQLRAMRAAGQAPQIVALQESFTTDARAIAATAGYRYVADGPDEALRDDVPMTPRDTAFAGAARWWKGERSGKVLGSGLQLLSDYPIVSTAKVAFPSFACAGYDCLANKGALLVSIRPPGAATPIDIVTTHLNSRHSSHVPDARSLFAYARQVGVLSGFVRAHHDPSRPLIAAGDFNVGIAQPRRAALLSAVRSDWGVRMPIRDALHQAERTGAPLSADAAFSLRRARDWQFYASGSGGALRLAGLTTPFGRSGRWGMLSDHVGYVARFRLEKPTAG